MPSNRSGASYNSSSSSQKINRHDYGRSQPGRERKGSVDDFQKTKIGHSDADNTILPSKRADTATRSLSGHLQSQPQSIQQFPALQGVPDPCRSVEKLHEFLPDCGKTPGPSQYLQIPQCMASIDREEKHDALDTRMEEKQPSTTQESVKTAPVASSSNSNVKKKPQAPNKGKGNAPATKTYSQGYRMPWKMMELQKKEEARLKYQK
ncbi:hypothetical protein O181_106798 [Austropuccinia psidii MF-1]|uniref:Uncharacterized protein n=1 Tax=Austropuccinia psidii MF-1 TaxID=1389203 RepID=A0A9Q3JPN5_9BASI|nr:hypothetical protein [Austropuccinia psidii MF-1]